MRHVVAAAILVVGAGAFAGGDVGAGGRGGVLLVVGHAFYCSAFPCIYTYIYIYYLYITFSVATDFFPGVRSGTVHSKVMSYLSSFSCPKKTRLRIEIIELQRLFIE